MFRQLLGARREVKKNRESEGQLKACLALFQDIFTASLRTEPPPKAARKSSSVLSEPVHELDLIINLTYIRSIAPAAQFFFFFFPFVFTQVYERGTAIGNRKVSDRWGFVTRNPLQICLNFCSLLYRV